MHHLLPNQQALILDIRVIQQFQCQDSNSSQASQQKNSSASLGTMGPELATSIPPLLVRLNQGWSLIMWH